MTDSSLVAKRILALCIFGFSLWWWSLPGPSDVIYLIINWKPVLFNRYSQGHFGVLLLFTAVFWAYAAALWARGPAGRHLGNASISVATTFAALLALTYISGYFATGPRYVEMAVDGETEHQVEQAGIVRHRPPNERYELIERDEPKDIRSYPDAPSGHPPVSIVLTSDERGFRNPSVSGDRFDVVVVGDSFAAGSHVSDDQGWTEHLLDSLNGSLYNLGVSGTSPQTYLNNFAWYGVDFEPRLALFMIYEGNDFKEKAVFRDEIEKHTVEKLEEHIEEKLKASPVTAGLHQLSRTVFERVGASAEVPHYRERVGFMPVELNSGGKTHHYAFEPRRLHYLNQSYEGFSDSDAWLATREILEEIADLSRRENIVPVFLYAPSTPHVVMPFAEDGIPADQLRNFLAYGSRRYEGRAPDRLKAEVFGNLDNQERVFLHFCKAVKLACLSLTPALQQATAEGIQTYYTYDQHWTPAGNLVVAEAVERFLRERQLTPDDLSSE